MRILLAGFWLLATICTGIAQNDKNKPDGHNKPDLSGTWILDASRSNLGSNKDKITDYTVTIVHREPEIRITRKFKQGGQEFSEEAVYYTDGRPEFSPNFNDPQPATNWHGRKLTRRVVTGNHVPIHNIEVTLDEEWELSKDSKTLIRTMSSSSSSNRTEPVKVKYIFTRASQSLETQR
jgi:hypothetical protein